MKPGDRASIRQSFTHADLDALTRLTGADHPGHVPLPLIAAMISRLLGTQLPGPGTNYLKQELQILADVPVGAEVTAEVEVTRLRADRRLVDLWASCRLADGTLVLEGRTLVRAPRRALAEA